MNGKRIEFGACAAIAVSIKVSGGYHVVKVIYLYLLSFLEVKQRKAKYSAKAEEEGRRPKKTEIVLF